MPSRNTTRPGIKFETDAISRIKGAIIDELRAIDWIPRSVRFKAREVEKAYAHLENRLHRTRGDQPAGGTRDRHHPLPLRGPDMAEIGQVLGVTESRVCQMHTKAVLQLRGKVQDVR
jgi:DNA-directed RNA polymerase specialized sigma subunit